jgi:pimeloyl-ACP methyl ester carboxylesterase
MLGASARAGPHRYPGRVAVTTLTTVDGVQLAAHTRRGDRARATVVVAHGFTASATHADVEALAGAVHERGFDVISYDARGHGRSGGRCTLGDLERHDVAAAVAAARPGAGPVVLVGVSMGAIAVLRHAADRPAPGGTAIAGVVTVSSPARWKLPRNARGLLSAGITSTPPGRFFAARRLGVRLATRRPRPAPPIELVRALDVPLALVHALEDPFIPATEARALYDAAPGARRLDLVPGAWHANGPGAVPAVLGALDWIVTPADRPG